jgi:hypothetical protein
MHARRFACFFLGLWLAGSLFMALVAYENLREVDRLLSRENPVATLHLKPLGADAPGILRYEAAEQNRWYFTKWGTAQLVLGGLFFLLMLFGSREDKFLLSGILLLVLLALLQKAVVTPELIALGRETDFLPPTAHSADQNRYQVVQAGYFGVEALKGVLALLLTGRMIFSRSRSGRSRDSRREFDRVDKADYRRVYR